MCNFNHRVRERAYFKYIDRLNNNIGGDANSDWEEATREQIIEERIREEAFLHSKNTSKGSITDWMTAEKEINERIGFLAFHLHLANINKTAQQNWLDAQKLYIDKF